MSPLGEMVPLAPRLHRPASSTCRRSFTSSSVGRRRALPSDAAMRSRSSGRISQTRRRPQCRRWRPCFPPEAAARATLLAEASDLAASRRVGGVALCTACLARSRLERRELARLAATLFTYPMERCRVVVADITRQSGHGSQQRAPVRRGALGHAMQATTSTQQRKRRPLPSHRQQERSKRTDRTHDERTTYDNRHLSASTPPHKTRAPHGWDRSSVGDNANPWPTLRWTDKAFSDGARPCATVTRHHQVTTTRPGYIWTSAMAPRTHANFRGALRRGPRQQGRTARCHHETLRGDHGMVNAILEEITVRLRQLSTMGAANPCRPQHHAKSRPAAITEMYRTKLRRR